MKKFITRTHASHRRCDTKKNTRARDDDDNNINANVHEENEAEEKSSTDRGRRREHADSVSARRRIVTHGAR
jgi:hypothetical protein